MDVGAVNTSLHVYFSWAPGGPAFTLQGMVDCWVTRLKSSSATSSSDDPQIHLILATQRRWQGFLWTFLSLPNLRFQMLFWATWFRGEARPLGGKCEILWSSSTHLWLYKNYPRVRARSRWQWCSSGTPASTVPRTSGLSPSLSSSLSPVGKFHGFS